MTTAIQIVQNAYNAFGRKDIPDLLNIFADKFDCGDFFVALADPDQPHTFEPCEFIESDDQVTVVSREEIVVLDNGQHLTAERQHLFTVRNNKIVHWHDLYNAAARHDH